MNNETLRQHAGRMSRRNFLFFSALTPFLAVTGVLAAENKNLRLAESCDIVFVSSLGFVKTPAEQVILPAEVREYLEYGNLDTRRLLASRIVHPDADLLKACVRDWPKFVQRVREDAIESFYPGTSGDPLAKLTPYSAIGMAVKLAADRINYDFRIAALAGNDDLNGDGYGDGLNKEMLARVPISDKRKLARGEIQSLRETYIKRARRIDSMSIDELYEHGVGVCRHQTIVAMAVFRALKEGSSGLDNLYLAGLASAIDRHQWLMAAAVSPDSITVAFYDPTASSADRARAVRAFKDAKGKQRYMGIPTEEELRREMGLE